MGQMSIAKIPRKLPVFKKPQNGFVKYGSPTKMSYTKPFGTQDSKKWCPYHKTNSHGMEECVVIKKLAMSASESREKKNSNPTKVDRNDYQNFIMFKKMMAYQDKKKSMMMIEEPEEGMIEEVMEDPKEEPDMEEETNFDELFMEFGEQGEDE
jgi:hypothetical protein